jgi:hypothetical protein
MGFRARKFLALIFLGHKIAVIMKNLFILLVLFAKLWAGESCDVLFYLQDAGETYGLLPVAEQLSSEGMQVCIAASGTAEKILRGKGVEYTSLESLGYSLGVDWPREGQLKSCVKVTDSFAPKVFVSGVAFSVQGQLYGAFRDKGVATVAFWDNFNGDGENPYFATAHRVRGLADQIWVPTRLIGRDWLSCVAVGHPSLESWAAEASQVQVEEVRGRLEIDPGEKLILWIGGYGPDYEEAFRLLLSAAEEATVFIQPHPKYGGEIESNILQEEVRSVFIHFIPNGVSTVEAVAAADVVVCHQSTVGFQALFLGKPVIYVLPPNQQFESLPLQEGLAYRMSCPCEWDEAFGWASRYVAPNCYRKFDVPEKSVEICVNLLRIACSLD